MRHIPRLRILLGRSRHVRLSTYLPTYRAELGCLSTDELWHADVFLGGLCYLACNFRRVHSHTSTTTAEDTAIAETAEGGIDGSFLSRIFVSVVVASGPVEECVLTQTLWQHVCNFGDPYHHPPCVDYEHRRYMGDAVDVVLVHSRSNVCHHLCVYPDAAATSHSVA